MLPIFSHRDIAELHQIRNAAVRNRQALAERYEGIQRELDDKREQNGKSRRQLAVMRRRIKDIQKDIFMMNSTESDLDETSVAMLLEIGNKKKRLSELKNQADHLSKKFDAVASDIQRALMDIADLEVEYHTVAMDVASLEKEKHELSDAITICLEHTSLERKKVEAELNDLSAAFLRIIDERQAIEGRLAERKAACEELSTAIEELTQKISALEEIKPILDRMTEIRQEVADMKAEMASLDTTRRTLLKEMNDRQRQFEAATSENMEMTAANTAVENDVGLYEKIMSDVKNAQTSCDHAKSRMEQVSDGLMEKLITKTALDRAIQDIWIQFDTLSEFLKESHRGS